MVFIFLVFILFFLYTERLHLDTKILVCFSIERSKPTVNLLEPTTTATTTTTTTTNITTQT
jgi:hypothetical protein